MPSKFGMPFLLETATVDEAAALCAQLGLHFVELNMNFPACQRLNADHLHRLMGEHGIFFTLHVEEDFDPFSFNLDVRNAWLASLGRALALAKAIHAPVVNMHLPKGIYITLPKERVYLYSRYEQEYRQALLELREMCQRELAGSGTVICVENTEGFAPHEREAVAFLLESPVFGLTLDIGHSHAVGDVDIPFYLQHEERLVHMHGHDARGKSNHLALGDGEIDLAQRFAWAERRGANVVLETKTVEALRSSVAALPKYTK